MKLEGIKRGRMTAEEDELVEQLAGRGWQPGRVAAKLNRHRATIQWAFYRLGLRAAGPATGKVYQRNGVTVREFTAEEDLYIETLRTAGHATTTIAKAASARFGTNRKPHAIIMRLTMLAGRELNRILFGTGALKWQAASTARP